MAPVSVPGDMFEFPAQGARPVWIASYPRSGNTFLRIILEKCFQLPSYSIYHAEGDTHHDPSADALEDAPVLPADWRRRLRDSENLPPLAIKTHGPPTDDAPAIFIARDGRAAVHSYYHYHKKFAFEQPSLLEVIAGACQFGSWSEHYWAWRPRSRAKTLLVHYEELVGQPHLVIPRLAAFLGRPAAEVSLPQFEELQHRAPAFFRRGSNTDFLTEWSPVQMALFNQLHAAAMKDLGFELAPSSASAAEASSELAQSAARLHRLYLEQLTNIGQAMRDHQRETQRLAGQLSVLTDWVKTVHEPLVHARWVRFGVALGMVPVPSKPEFVTPAASGIDPRTATPFKPSAGNIRSFSPGLQPASPSVPNGGASGPA